MNTILKCIDVKKKYGKKEILKNISFEVCEGDIMAFIGPNGSGKTTTIKLILGLNSITEGTILINGSNIKTDFANAIKKVGAIVENPDSYMYLTGYENLLLIANLYDYVTKEDIDNIVKTVGLETRIHDKVSKYSLGMRQRLGIAKALIMKPNLLILDEPTNGLDPEGIRELRDLLVSLSKSKMAILISSHNLSELENFCTKVCIISKGEVISKISSKDINENINEYYFSVSDTKDIDLENVTNKTDNSFTLTVEKENINNIIKGLMKKNIQIYEIVLKKISLEQAFLEKTGGNKID